MSLVELVVASGLTAFVIGLSVTPIVQMKRLEKRAEFQSSLDLAHQIALQKSRNGTYLKERLGISPGNPMDQCFGGRGTNCSTVNAPAIDNLVFKSADGYEATSGVSITVFCAPTKCTRVQLNVETSQTAGEHLVGWTGRPLKATFSVPATALSSRQEIDFSKCVGKVITGINYETLTAECIGMSGTTTCSTIAGAGPMSIFGQADPLDAKNCQPPVNQTCPDGMASFGMINGQAQCAPALKCADPFSAACQPKLPPGCVPNWTPDANTFCDKVTFTQTDSNNCPTSVPQVVSGTNPAVCTLNNCITTGALKWPDPVLGPCGSNATMTATAGSTGSLNNENLGYAGSITASCLDQTPAPNVFNLASASMSCNPIVCSGLTSVADWSAVGMKSAAAGAGLDTVGPWNCSGTQVITQATAQPPGILVSQQADPSAKAFSANTASTATLGGMTVTCHDPGPASAPRAGVLSISGLTCESSKDPYCAYTCIDNFMDGASGSLEPGETSTDQCQHMMAKLTKFSMGCTGYNGATCSLTNPTGPTTKAVCAGGSPPVCPAIPGMKAWAGVPNGQQISLLNCFVAGTQVTLESGDSKNIENVQIGDRVRTYDELTGQLTVSPVEEVLHHEEKLNTLYTFEFSNGNKVTSNDVHLFYSLSDRNYVAAEELYDRWIAGRSVVLFTDEKLKVSVLHIEKTVKSVRLYNIHVTSIYDTDYSQSRVGHNYFAGGVLVHNIKDVDGVCNALGLDPSGPCEDYSQPPTSQAGMCCQASGAKLWITQTGQREVWCQGTCAQMQAYNSCLSSGTPVDGKCGADNQSGAKPRPVYMCDAGSISAESGTGPYIWTCSGINGGKSANCTSEASVTSCPAVPAVTCSQNVINIGLEHTTGDIPQTPLGSTVLRQDFAFTDDTCSKGLKNINVDCTCGSGGVWNCVPRFAAACTPGVDKQILVMGSCVDCQVIGYDDSTRLGPTAAHIACWNQFHTSVDCYDKDDNPVADGTTDVHACYTNLYVSGVLTDISTSYRCDKGVWKLKGNWAPGCIDGCFQGACPKY